MIVVAAELTDANSFSHNYAVQCKNNPAVLGQEYTRRDDQNIWSQNLAKKVFHTSASSINIYAS